MIQKSNLISISTWQRRGSSVTTHSTTRFITASIAGTYTQRKKCHYISTTRSKTRNVQTWAIIQQTWQQDLILITRSMGMALSSLSTFAQISSHRAMQHATRIKMPRRPLSKQSHFLQSFRLSSSPLRLIWAMAISWVNSSRLTRLICLKQWQTNKYTRSRSNKWYSEIVISTMHRSWTAKKSHSTKQATFKGRLCHTVTFMWIKRLNSSTRTLRSRLCSPSHRLNSIKSTREEILPVLLSDLDHISRLSSGLHTMLLLSFRDTVLTIQWSRSFTRRILLMRGAPIKAIKANSVMFKFSTKPNQKQTNSVSQLQVELSSLINSGGFGAWKTSTWLAVSVSGRSPSAKTSSGNRQNRSFSPR